MLRLLRLLRAVAVAVASFAFAFAFVACRPAPVRVAPPPPPPAVVASPRVKDALGAADGAWVYVDGRQFRDLMLPDLLRAAGTERADVQVALSSLEAECGFQPLLAVEELFARAEWDPRGRIAAWGAVLRMVSPFERDLLCFRALAPGAQATSLDGHPAFQSPTAFLAWDNGVFVVGSSALEVRALMERMARPDSAMLEARDALSGVVISAGVRAPQPFEIQGLGVRWVSERAGSRLEVRSRFTAETNARRAETILKGSLFQMVGANASLDPGSLGFVERLAEGVTVGRDGSKLDVSFDLPKLSGQTELVSRLTSFAVRGVRLYTAWDRMGEARDAVAVIARALSDYALRMHALGRPVRFPPSAPLVPDDIPYGKSVVPNPHAFLHPSWQDIRYSNDRPTYYACDFVTSKDGRSVVVRARGDIDGDGTTSLFELDVRLDSHDNAVVAPLIRERDAEE